MALCGIIVPFVIIGLRYERPVWRNGSAQYVSVCLNIASPADRVAAKLSANINFAIAYSSTSQGRAYILAPASGACKRDSDMLPRLGDAAECARALQIG